MSNRETVTPGNEHDHKEDEVHHKDDKTCGIEDDDHEHDEEDEDEEHGDELADDHDDHIGRHAATDVPPLLPRDGESLRFFLAMTTLFFCLYLGIWSHNANTPPPYRQPPRIIYSAASQNSSTFATEQNILANYNVLNKEGFRDADLTYAEQYFRPGELQLNPIALIGRANIWLNGEGSLGDRLGCGYQVAGAAEQLYIATWFYPCGSRVKVTNPETGLSEYAIVADRGPDRYLDWAGYENDAIRFYVADLTLGLARKIGHASHGTVLLEPADEMSIPPESFGPFINLFDSPPFYQGIATDGTFLTSPPSSVLVVSGIESLPPSVP